MVSIQTKSVEKNIAQEIDNGAASEHVPLSIIANTNHFTVKSDIFAGELLCVEFQGSHFTSGILTSEDSITKA
jgi:hypothetical protein